MKAAVLFKEGFETIEALTVVDVFSRANVPCLMIGMDDKEVKSSHGITVKMDMVFDQCDEDLDMVVLPGGLPGATNLQADDRVISLLKKMNDQGKWIGAICAGPISLETAQVIKGKKYTCYPGFEEQITSGTYTNSLVEVDGNIVTARGPAATLQFAYTLLDCIGGNSEPLQEGMQYLFLKEEFKK